MPVPIPFADVARFPRPGDNVAIATRRLDAGAEIRHDGRTFELNSTVLEGHRFAAHPIRAGKDLLSWELPFGHALHDIQPGEYVCNRLIVDALAYRTLDFEFPREPNFEEKIVPYQFDESRFRPGAPTARYTEDRTFQGYRRSPARGVGTRNVIMIVGVTSRSASYAKKLEERLASRLAGYPNIDGVAALAHSEGSGLEPMNNLDLVMRALAAMFVHPNVGAVLAVDYGMDPITGAGLRDYLDRHSYPYHDMPHRFLDLTGEFAADLAEGEQTVLGWAEEVNATCRTPQSLAHLNIALQCGGSDAFSGVTGNPLAASVAKEVIHYGGSANLGEADELIGSESYMLSRVRDIETARQFLTYIEDFKALLAWHGASAESNPSSGNLMRGLYNIILKSIGAAMKKDPDVRLDFVVDYAERIREPGYYFVNSPGHDVEGLAGQVATGSNLIFFITGNGSVTNFPFVPTLKFITTTGRYQLLNNEMDINAGALIDGRSMEALTRETLDHVVDVASGTLCLGEKAGHSQISLWRNWRQADASQVETLLAAPAPDRRPIPIPMEMAPAGQYRFQSLRMERGLASDAVGLVMPTSLCSSQIARISALRLNNNGPGLGKQVRRYASLVHTEGCAVGGRDGGDLCHTTLFNYTDHPIVRFALFLEHGCDMTHNDLLRNKLVSAGKDPDRFGWASVQLDGGIAKVMDRIDEWFDRVVTGVDEPAAEGAGLGNLRLGLMLVDPAPAPLAPALARIVRMVVGAGGTIIMPRTSGLRRSTLFLQALELVEAPTPSLAYGASPDEPGFHLMEMPTEHGVEALTGLGAGGVEVILMALNQKPAQGHPLIPTLQLTCAQTNRDAPLADFDLVLDGAGDDWVDAILDLLLRTASRTYEPKLLAQGNVDFQITRGLLGVSL